MATRYTLIHSGKKISDLSATTSAELATKISDETGTGALVFGTSPTFTTSIFTPLVLGGTSTTQDLTLQTTSGIGASGADMHFLVGNNGATEAMRILNSGIVLINATAVTSSFAGKLWVSQALGAIIVANYSTIASAFINTAGNNSPALLVANDHATTGNANLFFGINGVPKGTIGYVRSTSSFGFVNFAYSAIDFMVKFNGDGSFVFQDAATSTERFKITKGGAFSLTAAANVKISGTAVRATTEGTNHLDIFDGTAPVGTLANGISLFSASGKLKSADAAGTVGHILSASAVNVVSPTAPNRTITVDIGGTTYYLSAKTTND